MARYKNKHIDKHQGSSVAGIHGGESANRGHTVPETDRAAAPVQSAHEVGYGFKKGLSNMRKAGTTSVAAGKPRSGQKTSILGDVNPECWGPGFTKSG